MARRGSLLAALVLLLVLPAGVSAIVGGRAVQSTAYPWVAALPDCGGSLISPDRVLTAAHCVNGLGPGDLQRITLGDGTVRAARAVAVHPSFVRRSLDGTANLEAPRDDIALVLLAGPVTTRPVALAAVADVTSGRGGVVLGRGLTSAPPPRPGAAAAPGLRAADLRVISDTACARFYRTAPKVYRRAFAPATMACAADPRPARRPQRSACFRDSGGPLVVRRGGAWRLAGVISWGERCGAEGDPTVFTDVPRYRAFAFARSPVTAPVAGTGRPTVEGDGRVGATLTCTAPEWVTPPDSVRYTWSSYRYQDGAPTRQSGASRTYVVGARDAQRLVQCTVLGATAGGLASAGTSAGLRIAG